MRRDAGLDLVKWLAMLSMLLDHLRYLWHLRQATRIDHRLSRTRHWKEARSASILTFPQHGEVNHAR